MGINYPPAVPIPSMADFFLNPNIAYLFIVTGFMVTVFAMLTPGTGVLEIAALALLGVVAYQTFSMEINVWALVVLLLAVVPFIFALRQKRITLNLVLTGLAFVVGSSFLFREDAWWQPAVHPTLAIVVSLLGGGFFYVMAEKTLEARAQIPTHDLSSLIGAEGEARTDILQQGSVFIHRELWSAWSDKKIKAGTAIKVVAREGLKLKVEAMSEKKK